jgi:uncharacterized repeat protein (TIGR01451 family)
MKTSPVAFKRFGIAISSPHLRRTVALVLLLFLFVGVAPGQNLVPNPSFESKTSCPAALSASQILGVTSWTAATNGSPDYFHTCASSASGVSVPANTFGNQSPRTGQAYAGFIARPSNLSREYLQTPLTSPLVAGLTYKVSFYLSLSDGSQWATDKLGAYFSAGAVTANTSSVLGVVPQIVNPAGTFITGKTGWTLVSGTYTSLGGEDHLVIGNFATNSSSNPQTGLGGFYPGCYYYIDDVSVEKATVAGTCNLVIGKSPSKGSIPLRSGAPVTFEVVVRNQGSGVCSAPISVTDSFSAGLTYVSSGGSGWVCPPGPLSGSNAVTCTNNLSLGPNQASLLLLTFNVTAPPGAGVKNCATLNHPKVTNPAKKHVCLKLPVVGKKGCDLAVTKTISPNPLVKGQPANITITLKNVGDGKCDPGEFPGTILRDAQPAGMTFAQPVSITQSGGNINWQCGHEVPSNNLTCATPAPLPPGYSATFTFSATVTGKPGSSITNCATVNNANDTDPANNKSYVTAKIKTIFPASGRN